MTPQELMQQCLALAAECVALCAKCYGNQEACNQCCALCAQCCAMCAKCCAAIAQSSLDEATKKQCMDICIKCCELCQQCCEICPKCITDMDACNDCTALMAQCCSTLAAGLDILGAGPDSDMDGRSAKPSSERRSQGRIDLLRRLPAEKRAAVLANLTNHREERMMPIAEVRAEGGDKNPKIIGYAAVFDSPTTIRTWYGSWQERIAPGAFRNALLTSDTRALLNHDPNYVLGRTKNATLVCQEDDHGLRVEITPPDTQWARDLLVSIRRGDVSQMSFGFSVAEDGERWDELGDGEMWMRTIEQVDTLYDVSPVTFPAYADTEVGVRSHEAYRKVLVGQRGQSTEPDGRLALLQARVRMARLD